MKLDLTVSIGEVAETIRGVTYAKAEARSSPRQGYSPLIRATNIDHGALVLDSFVYVPDVVIRDDQRLRVGDIVLAASSGSLSVVGKAALLRSQWQGTFGAFCYAVRPRPERVVPDYLAYFMQTSTYRSRVSKLAAGVNINNLRREHIESVELPYCALSEQRRIVEAIDSCVTRLDDAIVSLERAQAKLKAYRSSVLKAAVEGRLVPTEASLARKEKRDYESAEVLLARILKERRRRWEAAELAKLRAAGKAPKNDKWKANYPEPAGPDTSTLPELPEGWCWASWPQIGFSQNGRAFPSGEYRDAGVRLLRPGNLHESGRVEWNEKNTRHLPKRWASDHPAYVIGPDELVLNLTAQSLADEFLGRICLTAAGEHCLLNQRIARLTPILSSPRFMLCVFKSPWFRKFVGSLNTGSLIQHMFTSQLEDFALPLPPLVEQERIAAEVERLNTISESSMTSARRSAQRAQTLRQAVLRWAFEGKLVNQDPNGVLAEGLLARIRAERNSRPITKTLGRRARGAA